MNKSDKVNYIVLILSLFLALFLEMLPAPSWAVWFKPEWLLLIIFFWILHAPTKFNVTFAWLLGLLMDAMKGTLLGEHALAMLIASFLFLKLQRRFKLYPMWQQCAFILFFIFIYQFVIFIIQGIIDQLPSTYLYWGPTISSLIFWPWIYVLLRDWNKKFAR